jgi:NADPH-dependent curcumin reductase CurA
VQLSDFRVEETTVPAPGAGQILLAVQYLSLDPYMRGRMDDRKSYAKPVQIGEVMVGESVATVIASNHSGYAEGDTVVAPTGWRTHFLSDGTGLRKLDPTLAPVTTALGVLGMPGFTAYSGLYLIGKASPGETVVVAAASGPVGSLVGQLAKIVGARAVGIAGGPDKCRYVKDELGFDAAIDHRTPDFAEKLAEACQDGIDIYFENVGGAIWQAVLPLLNGFARVPVCGLIAQYNATGAAEGHPARLHQLRVRRGALSAVSPDGIESDRRGSGSLSRRHHRWTGECAGSLHWHAGGTQLRQGTRPGGVIASLFIASTHPASSYD